jgi:hypothetical protein
MRNTPNNSKNKDLIGLKHQMEFLDFIEWIATPSTIRSPKTQQELAKKFGVGQDTISEWKNRPRFWASVYERRRQFGRERMPDVIMALYNRIMRTGNAPEVKLWLQYFENWSERIITTTPTKRPYQDLTNAELFSLEQKLKNFLLKK